MRTRITASWSCLPRILRISIQKDVWNVTTYYFYTCRKKNHCFLLHYNQLGASVRSLNISRRGNVLTTYSINYSTHKNSYDFFDAEKTTKDFISVVDSKFVPRGKVKIQGSIDIINYQPAGDEIIELESRRTWLTDVYNCVYFNTYVQKEFSKKFIERVIVNGLTGNSWRFKRFESLSVIVTAAGSNSVLA